MEPNQNQESEPLVVVSAVNPSEPKKEEVTMPIEPTTESIVPTSNVSTPSITIPETKSTYISPRTLKLLYTCIGLFVISSLGLIPAYFGLKIFADSIYFWYIAMWAGIGAVAILFVAGVIKGFTGKSFKLVGVSIIFLVILALVGTGTCLVNLMGMGLAE
jgi:hypothetical protein